MLEFLSIGVVHLKSFRFSWNKDTKNFTVLRFDYARDCLYIIVKIWKDRP